MLTVKNENIGNSDLEKVLKDKMNELSDSVDCFDKISARAFPEKDPNFYESGFTVSDLENVTGRRDHGRLLRWAALAAAVVLCIVFIPKTGIIQRVLANLGGSVTKDFQQIITEINNETELHDYQLLDVPLDYYLKNDVLITPLFSCPFEDCGKDDAMVRIYIREVGAGQFTNFDTAQVYAVEYIGEYSEENIVAAARSAYRVTDDDFKNAVFKTIQFNPADEALALGFTPDTAANCINSSDGQKVSVASLDCNSYIKIDDTTVYACSTLLYGHEGCESSEEYFYDIITYGDDGLLELPSRQAMWKESVYYNGSNAFPREYNGNFTRKELFPRDGIEHDADSRFSYIGPFNNFNYPSAELIPDGQLRLCNTGSASAFSTVTIPTDTEYFNSLRVYYAYAPDTSANSNGQDSTGAFTVMCNWRTLFDVPFDPNNRFRREDVELESIRQTIELQQALASESKEQLEMELVSYNEVIATLKEQLEYENDAFERDTLNQQIKYNELVIKEIEKTLGSDE